MRSRATLSPHPRNFGFFFFDLLATQIEASLPTTPHAARPCLDETNATSSSPQPPPLLSSTMAGASPPPFFRTKHVQIGGGRGPKKKKKLFRNVGEGEHTYLSVTFSLRVRGLFRLETYSSMRSDQVNPSLPRSHASSNPYDYEMQAQAASPPDSACPAAPAAVCPRVCPPV